MMRLLATLAIPLGPALVVWLAFVIRQWAENQPRHYGPEKPHWLVPLEPPLLDVGAAFTLVGGLAALCWMLNLLAIFLAPLAALVWWVAS